ncbi:hypothetical protein [Mesorhizobium sp. A556]
MFGTFKATTNDNDYTDIKSYFNHTNLENLITNGQSITISFNNGDLSYGLPSTPFTTLEDGNQDFISRSSHGLHLDFSGGIGQATFVGGDRHDVLIGGSAGDFLLGGDGDDTLVGGPGADTLTGGAGNDTFSGTASELNGDTITDLSIGDIIQLTDGKIFESVGVNLGVTELQFFVNDGVSSFSEYLNTGNIGVTGGTFNLAKTEFKVTDVNDAPTGISLSLTTIEENAPGAIVGTLTATDPDSFDAHTYSLVSGAGDTDNAGSRSTVPN